MQKSLFIVLAVCLIGVHAFVKREAPVAADNTNYLEDIQKQLGDLTKPFSDTINSDQMQKGFNDAVAAIQDVFEDLKTKTEAQKKE